MENNFYQEYLADNLTVIHELNQIVSIDWCEALDEYHGDYTTCILSGIRVEDKEGNLFVMGVHDPHEDRQHYEVDCLLLNFLVQKVFQEAAVDCPYSYPLNLQYVCGLVNDARQLLTMKNRGEDLSGFTFVHCLLDLRKDKMMNIAPEMMQDAFGCGDDLDALVYMIEHA